MSYKRRLGPDRQALVDISFMTPTYCGSRMWKTGRREVPQYDQHAIITATVLEGCHFCSRRSERRFSLQGMQRADALKGHETSFS